MTVATPTLNYTSFVSQLANLMVISSANVAFNTQLPGIIDYAEQRIYREIDFMRTQVTDATTTVSSGNREFTIGSSSQYFVSVDQISIITPVTASASNGTRNPVQMVSRDFIDTVYPSGQTVTGVPLFYAMNSDTDVIFGPAPDAAYVAEVTGEQRPTPLSASNSSTYLTQYIPDVFIAAAMVYACGYQSNFGAQSDDPRSAQSWEGQYQVLMQSAAVEQLRLAGKSQGWTPQSPNPIATPPRV
jgi:hypothetical protein